jgi:hypothetical protein
MAAEVLHRKRAPAAAAHRLFSTTTTTTTIGESPIRRPTLHLPNHDHFLVSPIANNDHDARMRDAILLVSPANSAGSINSPPHASSRSNHHKKKHHHPRSGHRQPMSPTNELRLQLLQRLAEYRAKGWINPSEEQKYIQRLAKHHPNFTDPTDNTARQLQQEMDQIADAYQRYKHDKHDHHDTQSSFNRIGGPLLPPSSTTHLRSPPPPALKKKKPNASRPETRRVSFAPMSGPTTNNHGDDTNSKAYKALISPNYNLPHSASIPETDVSESTAAIAEVEPVSIAEQQLPTTSIMEPMVLWDQLQLQEQLQNDDDGGVTPDGFIQNMFVEMCFFARLGFVQPPCCLYCAYRESVEKEPPNLECDRWVVWRKNALTLLHPHRLQGNLLAVQCQTARLLSNGQTIQAHSWDKQRKQVVLHM